MKASCAFIIRTISYLFTTTPLNVKRIVELVLLLADFITQRSHSVTAVSYPTHVPLSLMKTQGNLGNRLPHRPHYWKLEPLLIS